MIGRILIPGLLLFVVALVTCAGAAERDVKSNANGRTAKQAKTIFEKLKSLAGE